MVIYRPRRDRAADGQVIPESRYAAIRGTDVHHVQRRAGHLRPF